MTCFHLGEEFAVRTLSCNVYIPTTCLFENYVVPVKPNVLYLIA